MDGRLEECLPSLMCSVLLATEAMTYNLVIQLFSAFSDSGHLSKPFLNFVAPQVEKHCCYTASVYLCASQLRCCCMLLPVSGLSDKPEAGRSRGITNEFCAQGKTPLCPQWIGRGKDAGLICPGYPCSQLLWPGSTKGAGAYALATTLSSLTLHILPGNRGAGHLLGVPLSRMSVWG